METLRRIYAAIEQSDWEELRTNVTHDVEWEEPSSVPWGGTHHGPLGVEAIAQIFSDHVDGHWATPEEFLAAEETVVASASPERGVDEPLAGFRFGQPQPAAPPSAVGRQQSERFITGAENGAEVALIQGEQVATAEPLRQHDDRGVGESDRQVEVALYNL